jgi:hypothetical protein
MTSITTYIPHSDIEVQVEYEIRGKDDVVYSAAYVDGVELPADKLFFKDQHGNQTKLSTYFNFKLQDMASLCLAAE